MKKMKYLLASTILASLVLAGCGKTDNSEKKSEQPQTSSDVKSTQEEKSTQEASSQPDEENVTITKVTFEGLDDINTKQGSAVNPKSGVKVTAFYMENGAEKSFIITSYVTVTQDGQTLGTTCNTQNVGTFTLKYEVNASALVGFVFDSGLTLTQERTMVVEEYQVSAEELIKNGTFDEGDAHWANYTDGSNVQFDFSEGYMKCVESSISGNSYSPRLNTPYPKTGDEFTLAYGQTYLFQAELWADANKTVKVQLGTILPSDPWWIEYYDENGKGLVHTFDITTEKKLYTWQFTYTSNTAEEVHFTLEMGTVDGDATVTTVYADNISLKAAVDDGTDKLAPQLAGADNARVEMAETGTFDVLAGVVATDNVDGDISKNITYVIKNEAGTEVESIPLNVAGVYTVTYSVKDAAGNEKTANRVVKVVEPSTAGTNFGGMGSEVVVGGEADMVAAGATNTFYYWYVQDAGWNCGSVINATNSLADEKLTITASGLAANTNFWSSQLFYQTEELAAGQYIVAFKVNSDIARKLRVNGVDYDLVAGDNVVEFVTTLAAAGNLKLSMQMGGAELCTEDANTLVFSDLVIEQPLSTPTASTVGGEADMVAAGAVNTFYYWYVQDAGWNCGSVITATQTLENGALTIEASGLAANTNSWSSQLFYQTDELAAGDYVVCMDVNSDVERDIVINGEKYHLVNGDNHIHFTVSLAAAGNLKLSMQMGGAELSSADANKLVFSNLVVRV